MEKANSYYLLGSLFIITPWGYRAVKAPDNIFKIIFKGV